MRTSHLWLLCVVLAVGFMALASPAPVFAINTCVTRCTCSASCDLTCATGVPPEIETITCGEYGKCVGSGLCGSDPNCPAISCTTAIYGTSGNDTLNGGSSAECIYGYDGNDTIDGNAGDDQVWAGIGTDTVYGDSGNDCLYGEDGNDYLDGESGTDLANGGAGSDTCFAEALLSCP